MKDAEPYEKEKAGTYRLGVGIVSLKWLNIWGARHGLVFEKITGVYDCKGYFANPAYAKRSVIIGTFGRFPKGNWAHATAYYADGPAFFDPNWGEYDLGKVVSPGGALDNFHLYFKQVPGLTIDGHNFFALL